MERHKERDMQKKIRFVQDTQYVLGGKWKLPIIIAIYHDNTRFNAIKLSIQQITNRVLSKELKHLEINKLISRTVYSDYSRTVVYQLTEYCYTITDVLVAMESWGEQHRKKLLEAAQIEKYAGSA